MGQVCTRDDEVDKQAGNAPPTVGHQNDQGHQGMKHAALPYDPPKQEPKKEDKLADSARSQLEDVHVNAKNLEFTGKMNIPNANVQRKWDSLKPIKAENYPRLKERITQPGSTIAMVKDRTTQATYQGQMHRGVPHGWGKYIHADGSVIEGFFEEGNPSGYIRSITGTSAVGYEGEFSNHHQHGKGTAFDANGNTTEATWENGHIKGAQVQRNSLGLVIFEGTIVGGKKIGKCTWYDDKQRATLIGDFKDDFLEGVGDKTFENGQVYRGDFKRGVEEGRGTLTFVDGRKFEGTFSAGKANGKGDLITDQGRRVPATYKDGKKLAQA